MIHHGWSMDKVEQWESNGSVLTKWGTLWNTTYESRKELDYIDWIT